jgi:glyoxylase-like metal-dependent hydrolase (beta-lactamase superfamily II)
MSTKMIHIEQFIFNPFQENCSLVWDDDGHCAVVDPGYIDAERNDIVALIERKNLKPVCILLTHAHFDHIYGAADFARTYNVPVYMSEKESFTLEKTNPYVCGLYGLALPDLPYRGHGEILHHGDEQREILRHGEERSDVAISFIDIHDGDTIQVGSLRFEVLETPGHSVGGVCYLERNEGVLFSGDTIFAGAIGRTDHPGGDYDLMMKSIWEKIMCLDGDISVIPGHGPETDVATERMTNPFLLPFNEPYEE